MFSCHSFGGSLAKPQPCCTSFFFLICWEGHPWIFHHGTSGVWASKKIVGTAVPMQSNTNLYIRFMLPKWLILKFKFNDFFNDICAQFSDESAVDFSTAYKWCHNGAQVCLVFIHADICIHKYTFIFACAYIYTHARTHTNVHTCLQFAKFWWSTVLKEISYIMIT